MRPHFADAIEGARPWQVSGAHSGLEPADFRDVREESAARVVEGELPV